MSSRQIKTQLGMARTFGEAVYRRLTQLDSEAKTYCVWFMGQRHDVVAHSSQALVLRLTGSKYAEMDRYVNLCEVTDIFVEEF